MKTTVVIPVKNRLDLTQKVVHNLRVCGGWDKIIVFDNGSEDETWSWLAAQGDLSIFHTPKHGIYQMWNEGRWLAGKDSHVAILNNDVSFDEGFLQGLTQAFEDDERYGVMSPNTEGNPLMDHVGVVDELAGYAFVLRGGVDLPPFDENYSWYYGDTDYVRAVQKAGYFCGKAYNVRVRHIGRASTPPGLVESTADADAQRYREKWG